MADVLSSGPPPPRAKSSGDHQDRYGEGGVDVGTETSPAKSPPRSSLNMLDVTLGVNPDAVTDPYMVPPVAGALRGIEELREAKMARAASRASHQSKHPRDPKHIHPHNHQRNHREHCKGQRPCWVWKIQQALLLYPERKQEKHGPGGRETLIRALNSTL